MATAAPRGLFARKPTEMLLEETRADPEHGLKRAVGVLDLTALGIGAVIGTGIFVTIGDAGPSIIISFALAGVTACSRPSPTPSWRRRSRSRAARTRTATSNH